MDTLISVYGWYGVFAIVTAYFLNSFGALKSGLTYQLLNLTGAIGIVVVSLQKEAYPPAGLNTIWALIAAVSIGRILLKRRDIASGELGVDDG